MYLDRRLWSFTKGVRLRIAATVALGLLQVMAGIGRLALLGWLLARVFRGASLESLAVPILLTAAVSAVRGGLEYARAMIAHRTTAIVQARLRQAIYDQVVALGPAHFTRSRTGDVLVSMVEGVQQLEVYFGQYLPQLAVAALTPVLIFAFVATLDLPIALVLLGAALVTLLAPALWHREDSRASRARSKAYSAFAAEFLDSIQGLATLKAFGQSAARLAMLETRGWELFRSTMWVLGTNTLARGITDTGIAVGAAVALGWGAYRVRTGEMELSVLLVILMLGVEVFRPLRELRILLHQGMMGLSAAQGIFAILDAQPAVRDAAPSALGAPPAVGRRRLAPTVEFDRATFAYPGGRHPAHEGLSFVAGAGERVGIVGPSGSGKSTIARLLLRFYDPQGGRVLVGGHDVRTLSLDQLRGAIAVVSQDTYLFHGTVEDNLRMGKPDATPAELEAAARAANAHEFIERLPQRYRTVVGERGVRLSGGQRQRIAIARALLRDTPILILDEALSSVDAESEAVIQEALARLMQGRTTLIFAHRLSSVIGADRIVALEEGRAVESGRHAELMARRGAYYRLMAGQARDGLGAADFIDVREAAAFESSGDGAPAPGAESPEETAATDGIVRAQGLGWRRVTRILLGIVAPYRGRLAATFLLGLARVVSLIGVGVVSALIVRALAHGAPFGWLLVTLGVVAPLAGLLHWLESWLAHDMAFRLLTHMRLDIFRKLDALVPAYLTRRRSGDLVGVATHDVELIEYFFAHTIAPAFVAILVPAGVLATLFAFGWPLTLAVLPFLAYTALSPVLARARIDRLGSRAREASGEMNAHAVDTVQGLTEIVAFQRERSRGVAFAARARAYMEARLPFLEDLTRQTVFQEMATGLGGLAVVTVGATLVVGGRLEAGVLPLLTLLAMSAFVPVWEIAQVGRQLADTLGATRRVYAVHAEPIPVTDGPGVMTTLPTPPTLEMARVRFVYPGRARPALDDVSIAVPAGRTTALVGPSGAGKTTIAGLFLRFWDPAAGAVKIGGRDLRDYRLDEVRRQIALVAQDTYLFNDTLRNNILIARPTASEPEVAAAVTKASLDDFVRALPDGLDTRVGERGAQLSGGQRQRVAIARAFLKNAPVLILDEATSHLDAVNEQAVRDALALLARDRTTLVIAHRLSTVRDADQIIVLDAGRVVETGDHETLLAEGGLYARLVSRQLGAAASPRAAG
ncbi:MAG: ABC transporter [Candidatus Rokubacteria bacterium 13_2_20CM_69_15_1]|nr:MAG: ABC transporter [Candidatus Rokubacteria bacterium 13_2_20CM_69_15_1]